MQDAVVGTRRPCNQRHRGQAADKTEKHDTYGAIRHGDVTVETQGPGVSCKVGVPRIWAGSCKDTKVLLLTRRTRNGTAPKRGQVRGRKGAARPLHAV